MRPISLRHIRRMLIWVIVLVALAVAVDYFYARYLRNRLGPEHRQVLDSEMVQSSLRIEYSENKDGVLRFRIRAQKLEETRGGKNYLQGIEAYDFNPDGSVRNEIRSLKAEYDSENRKVGFTGDVRLFLGREAKLQTESLSYDLASNVGTTADRVRFDAGGAAGSAQGLYYNLDTRLLRLESDVEVRIAPEEPSSGGAGLQQAVHVSSDRAISHDNLNRIAFSGDARLESEALLLTADVIRAVMGPGAGRIASLDAAGRAHYRSGAAGDAGGMSGDRMVFRIRPGSRYPQSIGISGGAELDIGAPGDMQRLRGEEIDLSLDPETGMPSQVEGRTGVRLLIASGAERTFISGESFSARFSPGTGGLRDIEARQRARLSLSGSGEGEANAITAGLIGIRFEEVGRQPVLRHLRAEDSARWTFPREGFGAPSAPPDAAAASSGFLTAAVIEMQYSGDGGVLDRVDASGDVVMAEASPAVAGDSTGRMVYADRARFSFSRGGRRPSAMEAAGHVRVVDGGGQGSGGGFRTWSDRMEAAFDPGGEDITLASASQWGHFRYEDGSSSATAGRCDYDAESETIRLGDSPVIIFDTGTTAGEAVEFDRRRGIVRVRRGVRTDLSGRSAAGFPGGARKGSPGVIFAGIMRYDTASGQVRYTERVYLLSEDQQLRADSLDILEGGARLEARGGIRHIISRNRVPDAAGSPSSPGPGPPAKEEGHSPGMPIYIESSNLAFANMTNTVTYAGGVTLENGDIRLTCRTLAVVLDAGGGAVDAATATGNVVAVMGGKKCTGDVGHYFREPERFVVTGSLAELYDPASGRSYAPRLTYTVADGRMQLEQHQN